MTVPQPPIQLSWVAQPGDDWRYAIKAVGATLLRPAVALPSAIILVVLVLSPFVGGSPLVVGAAAFWIVGFPVLLFLLTLRRLRTTMRPGSVWVSGADEHALLIGASDGQSVIRYEAIASLTPRWGIVLLRAGGGIIGLPPALMPPPLVAHVRSRIGRTAT